MRFASKPKVLPAALVSLFADGPLKPLHRRQYAELLARRADDLDGGERKLFMRDGLSMLVVFSRLLREKHDSSAN
jgi:hypothetical protein